MIEVDTIDFNEGFYICEILNYIGRSMWESLSTLEKLHIIELHIINELTVMNKNIFLPFKGTDSISFGMNRETTRGLINSKYICLKRNEFAENTSDYYENEGFFIEFNVNDICEAIEFTNSGCLIYKDINLLRLSYTDIRSIYDSKSKNIEEEDDISVITMILDSV